MIPGVNSAVVMPLCHNPNCYWHTPSAGIVVVLDKRSGGATVDEFRRFTVEQTRARIMTPSPIPIIW